MRQPYHPTEDVQRGGGHHTSLRLGPRELTWSDASECHVEVSVHARSRGWLARIEGVHEQTWSLSRTFLEGEGRSDATTRFVVSHGLYEAECVLEPPCVERAGVYRAYIEYDEARGLKILTRLEFDARLRERCDVGFGDVRGLVAQQRWHEAERVCEFISDDNERFSAREYVAQQQGRWEQELPELEGSRLEVERASTLRQSGLTALRDFEARFARGEGPAKQELARARQWLIAQRSASFWTEHRDRLDGERLWEFYLERHVEL